MIGIGLELLRTAVLLVILVLLGRARLCRRMPDCQGWGLVIGGFSLLLFASLVDVADGFENLGRNVVIGDTATVGDAKSIVGYLGGFVLVMLGLIRGMPSLSRISDEIVRRRESEADLKASDALLAKTQRVAQFGSWRWSIDRNALVSCSEEYARIHGVGVDQVYALMEEQMERVIHPDDRERVEHAFKHFDETGASFAIEYRIIRPDGAIRQVIEHGEAEFDSSGRPVEQIGTVQDVTDQKLAEATLRESEARLREAQRLAKIGHWEWRVDGDVLRLSPEMAIILGVEADRLPTRMNELRDFVHPDDLGSAKGGAVRALEENVSYEDEYRIVRPGGKVRYIHELGKPLLDAECRLIGMRGTLHDITERKLAEEALKLAYDQLEVRISERTDELQTANETLRLEVAARKRVQEQLAQTQKMQAIGQLTGGIAHDFNNLLMIVEGYSRRAMERLDDAKIVEASLSHVLNATDKATSLTKQLLVFSRRQIMETRVFHVAETIGGIKGLLEHSVGERVVLRFEMDDAARVETDPNELSQAVVNLSVNARDAMPKDGTIVIGARLVDLDAAFTEGRTNISPGRFVEVYVKDEGAGIDDETLPHVFEPFFTTKEQGEGTGLGLAMVYGFAQQSGGAAAASSALGIGTTVSIFLPVSNRDPDAVRAEVDILDRGRGETILVVEDDAALLELTSSIIEDLGYTVLTASNGMEALEVDEEHEGVIDLILSDVGDAGHGRIRTRRHHER